MLVVPLIYTGYTKFKPVKANRVIIPKVCHNLFLYLHINKIRFLFISVDIWGTWDRIFYHDNS